MCGISQFASSASPTSPTSPSSPASPAEKKCTKGKAVRARRQTCDGASIAALHQSRWEEAVLREARASIQPPSACPECVPCMVPASAEDEDPPLPFVPQTARAPPAWRPAEVRQSPQELMDLFAPVWNLLNTPPEVAFSHNVLGRYGGLHSEPQRKPAKTKKPKAEKTKRMRSGVVMPAMPAAQEHEVTLTLRRLPLKYSPAELLQEFKAFLPHINFYYLPSDFETKKNLGYAFLNFDNKQAAADFTAFWSASGIPECTDSPVEHARVQGFDANVMKFRNSSVMAVLPAEFKPYIFSQGESQPFPGPEEEQPIRPGSSSFCCSVLTSAGRPTR